MITFIAHLRVKPQNAREFEALMTYVAEMTHRHEPGVVYYEFAKSVDELDTYVVVEVYRDREAHAAHMASAWVKESLPKSARLIEGEPAIQQYITPGDEPAIRHTQFSRSAQRVAEPEEAVKSAWRYSKRIVADCQAAERFYTAMGFKTLAHRFGGEDDDQVRQEQIYMSVNGDAAGNQLILCRFLAFAPPKPVYPGEAWLCLNVDDVDKACRTAEHFGGSVFRAGQNRPEHGVCAAVIADIDGHYIEIIGPMTDSQ